MTDFRSSARAAVRAAPGAPGYVWVDDEEIARLAAFRGETVERFAKRFVRRVGNRHSLIEKPGGDCIFWDAKAGCTVYPARPAQCQTWPFWSENLDSPEAWEHVTQICPGSGKGRWFSLEGDPRIRRQDRTMNSGDGPLDVSRFQAALHGLYAALDAEVAGLGPRLRAERPLLPVHRVRPYIVPLGPRGGGPPGRGAPAGASPRRTARLAPGKTSTDAAPRATHDRWVVGLFLRPRL